MRKLDLRILFGAGLILFGGLLLLERMGFLSGASDLFWGTVFVIAGAGFLYTFFQDVRRQWWAIIPALALFGLAGDNFLPERYTGAGGSLFLGALGVSFLLVYLTDRARWWAVIPGGVLVTLSVVAAADDVFAVGFDSGAILFIGLGLTFLLVALLPSAGNDTCWAYIPAVVLVLVGAFLGNSATAGFVDYLWPAALFIAGLGLIFGFFFKK
jgi:hypothetical protein